MKYSVITYIMGDYEVVRELEFDPSITPDVEYICVTDNPNLTSKTWKIFYDEDLNNNNLNAFDKVILVRYNLFKYCKNDICVRIDGSMQIKFPLDVLVEKFISEDYFGCLLLHPHRQNIIPEYITWVLYRGFNAREALLYLYVLGMEFNYDFRTKSLIQQGVSINRKTDITQEINQKMFNLLIKDDGHFTRLDQTIFTALITSQYNNLKWLFIDDEIFNGDYLAMYKHGEYNQQLFFDPTTFLKPFFNNREVEVYKLPNKE